jgi:hypothetical protein
LVRFFVFVFIVVVEHAFGVVIVVDACFAGVEMEWRGPFDLAVGVDGGGPAVVVDRGDRKPHATVLDGAVNSVVIGSLKVLTPDTLRPSRRLVVGRRGSAGLIGVTVPHEVERFRFAAAAAPMGSGGGGSPVSVSYSGSSAGSGSSSGGCRSRSGRW